MLKGYKKSDVRVTSTDPRHHDLAENPKNFDGSILQRGRGVVVSELVC